MMISNAIKSYCSDLWRWAGSLYGPTLAAQLVHCQPGTFLWLRQITPLAGVHPHTTDPALFSPVPCRSECFNFICHSGWADMATRSLWRSRARLLALTTTAACGGAAAVAVSTSEDPATALKLCTVIPSRLVRAGATAASIAFG